MPSTTLVVINLLIDNTENSRRFNLILVSYIRAITPQVIQGVSQKRPLKMLEIIS